jgi:hypothetical protein
MGGRGGEGRERGGREYGRQTLAAAAAYQWWSNLSTHTLHSEQCAARGGRKMRHVRHHLSRTCTPLTSTNRCIVAHASASASLMLGFHGTMPGSVVAHATKNHIVCTYRTTPTTVAASGSAGHTRTQNAMEAPVVSTKAKMVTPMSGPTIILPSQQKK